MASKEVQQEQDIELKTFEYNPKNRKEVDPEHIINPAHIFKAYKRIQNYVRKTRTEFQPKLSERYGCKVYFKREDNQYTSSYKTRGIFNKLLSLSEEEKKKGIICSTTGNQGAATGYACSKLDIKLTLVIPESISQVKFLHIQRYIGDNVTFLRHGNDMHEADEYAEQYAKENDLVYVNYDEDLMIYGCGTVGKEILDDIPEQKVDYIIYQITSGILSSGMGSYFKQLSPETVQIGVQPKEEDQFQVVDQKNKNLNDDNNMFEESNHLNKYRCKHSKVLQYLLDGLYDIDHGLACSFVTYLFDKEKIIVDPQSAIPPAGIDVLKDQLKDKVVVCVLSGNFKHDISILSEIKTLGDVYEHKLHYLLINFFTKHGALKMFLLECLGDDDQITQIEYTRKNNREKGPALVGIESPTSESFQQIMKNLKERKIEFQILKPTDELFKLKV